MKTLAAIILALSLSSCAGLQFGLGPDGRFALTGQLPVKQIEQPEVVPEK